MDSIIQRTNLNTLFRKVLMCLLIVLIYTKFVVQIVLDQSFVILDLLLYFLLLLSIDYRKVKVSIFFIFVLILTSLINPAARNIFLIFLSSYILSELKTETVIKINLLTSFTVLAFCSFFLLFGITKSEMFNQTLWDMRERWDYGMGNPNTFALFIYSVVINMYLLFSRKSKLVILFIVIVSYITYSYTASRTFGGAVLLLLIAHVLRFKLSTSCSFKYLLISIPVFVFFGVIYFSINVEKYTLINFLFSGRLELYGNFLRSLSLSHYIIGSPLINEETIDSSFLHIYFEGGVFVFIVFCLMIYKTIQKSTSKERELFIPLFISVFAMGLTESILTFILIFGNMIVWQIFFRLFYRKSINELDL